MLGLVVATGLSLAGLEWLDDHKAWIIGGSIVILIGLGYLLWKGPERN